MQHRLAADEVPSSRLEAGRLAQRTPRLELPFALLGVIAGWIVTEAIENPLFALGVRTPAWIAALGGGAVGAAVGALAVRWSRAEPEQWRSSGALYVRVVLATIAIAALAGASLAGLFIQTAIGALEGGAFAAAYGFAVIPVYILVLAAALRAKRARAGSVVARADRRAVWAVAATLASAATIATLADWPAALSGTGVARPWPALALAGAAATTLIGVLVADAAALITIRRATRAANEMEIGDRPHSEAAPRSGARSIDLGRGDDVRTAFARSADAYRGERRTVARIIGDPAWALAAIERAVMRSASRALLAAGVLLAHWLATRPKVVFAFEEHQCNAGSGDACRAAAVSMSDPQRSIDLHGRACARCSAASCKDLGRLLEEFGGQLESKRAGSLRRLSCDAGDGRSCRIIALALLRTKPWPRLPSADQPSTADEPNDLPLAVALLERGCAWGDDACCKDLPVLRAIPPGEYPRSEDIACLRRGGVACLVGRAKPSEADALLLERSCRDGVGWHCELAAWFYRGLTWTCPSRDARTDCAYRLVPGSEDAAHAAPERAYRLYELACDAARGMGCCEAAFVLFRGGERIPADRERARSLFHRAEALGFGNAGSCQALRAEDL